MHPSLSVPYKCPLHFQALFLNRDSFIHEFYNLPLDITPRSLLKAILDIAWPCVISTVNSFNATGAIAVLFQHARGRPRAKVIKISTALDQFSCLFFLPKLPQSVAHMAQTCPCSDLRRRINGLFLSVGSVVFLTDFRAAPTMLNHVINTD